MITVAMLTILMTTSKHLLHDLRVLGLGLLAFVCRIVNDRRGIFLDYFSEELILVVPPLFEVIRTLLLQANGAHSF